MPKLVRNRIPEIIHATGHRVRTRFLDIHEFKDALQEKLKEEVSEFLSEPSVEELADIVEVIHSLTEVMGYSWDDVEDARLDKRDDKGGFSHRVFLEEILPPTRD